MTETEKDALIKDQRERIALLQEINKRLSEVSFHGALADAMGVINRLQIFYNMTEEGELSPYDMLQRLREIREDIDRVMKEYSVVL